MAGAGYKLFNTGDVLTAQQVNEYLQQQTVMVFADSTARTTALSGVLAEGMMSYLQDTNVVQVYNGSSWVAVGGSSPLTTKGDLYTYSTTDARLAVGTNGQVLAANSSTSTGLEWQTISAGAMTSLASGSIAASATGFDLTSISGSYNELWLYIRNYSTSTSADIQIRTNGNTGGDYTYQYYGTQNNIWANTQGDNRFMLANGLNSTQVGFSAFVRFPDYKNTTGYKQVFWQAAKADNELWSAWGFTRSTSAISRITFSTTAGTFDSGTYELFGVK